MDGLLDLWIHEIYNDDCVLGSDLGSVVYFRDNIVREFCSPWMEATLCNPHVCPSGKIVRAHSMRMGASFFK